MNCALRRARGGLRFGRGLLLHRPDPQCLYLIPSRATSFSRSSSSTLSSTHKFLSPVSPSSSSSSSFSSFSHNHRHLTALRLQPQLQNLNPTHITLHPATHQPHQRPLLHTTVIGSSRRTFSFTSATQASNQVAMAEEWSAERVRDTFIGYFKKNGHTFGSLRLVLPCRVWLSSCNEC